MAYDLGVMTDRRGPHLNSNSQENLEAKNEEAKGKYKGWLFVLLICIGGGVFLFFLSWLLNPTSGWQGRIDSGNPVKYEEVGDLGETYYNELDGETGIRHVAWRRKHSPNGGIDYFSFLVARFKNGLMTNYAETSDDWSKVYEKFEEWNAHIPETFQVAEAEAQVASKPTPEPTPVSPADEKLIANPDIERAIRTSLEKPEGKLTETDLARVTELNLGYIEITDAGLKLNEVAKMKQPATINLSYTPITDASLKELAKLQKLTHLSLNGTKITDEGLKELAKLQNLEWLGLHDTKATDEGVAELKKALPNCSINTDP